MDAERVAAFIGTRSNAQHMSFRLGTVHVSPNIFTGAARAIRRGRVHVEEQEEDAGGDAHYNHPSNTLYVRDDVLTSLTKKALLMHEAVHIGLDVRAAARVLAIDDEAAAFVVQAMYMRNGGARFSTSGTGHPLWINAYTVGDVIIGGNTPTSAQIQALKTAVLSVPLYHDLGRERAGYGGV